MNINITANVTINLACNGEPDRRVDRAKAGSEKTEVLNVLADIVNVVQTKGLSQDQPNGQDTPIPDGKGGMVPRQSISEKLTPCEMAEKTREAFSRIRWSEAKDDTV